MHSPRRYLCCMILGSLTLLLGPPLLAVAPGNDDFDSATVISLLPYADALSTVDATAAADDPACVGNGPTVWYSFTPSSNVFLGADTFGSDYDTTLSVYTGTRGALTQVGCNDDSNGTLQSQLLFQATAGVTYHFMVGSFESGPGGSLVFHVEETVLPPGPSNDDFSNATVISGLTFRDALDTSGATTAADDPFCAGQGATVWYVFTPSVNTLVDADTFGSTYDTTLSVYTGTRGSLQQVACNDDTLSLQSQIMFAATAGTTYHIMVGSFDASPGGDMVLNVRAMPQVSGRHFVTGGGSWFRLAGLAKSGQNVQSVSINAWKDKRGIVRGQISWTWAVQVLPGGGGKLSSGYPWVMSVDTMIGIATNIVYLEGPVTQSGQLPSDVGSRVGWFVTDNGNGASTSADQINGISIEGGDFMVLYLNR